MNTGTWRLLVIWFVGGALAAVGYGLDWFDVSGAGLIMLITLPLGAEVRTITARDAR